VASGSDAEARENEFRKWKNAVVDFARPFLNHAYSSKEITKDEYKTILKKVADKVVTSHRAKHARPPPKCSITDGQAAAIKKLIDEYVDFTKKHWS